MKTINKILDLINCKVTRAKGVYRLHVKRSGEWQSCNTYNTLENAILDAISIHSSGDNYHYLLGLKDAALAVLKS